MDGIHTGYTLSSPPILKFPDGKFIPQKISIQLLINELYKVKNMMYAVTRHVTHYKWNHYYFVLSTSKYCINI